MIVEILGSGGSFTIPKPGCGCIVCKEARKKGIPFSRTGPSVFMHGPNILIDTPEESKEQLNRGSIKDISGCLYSHWHGDHVLGYRTWWSLNYDFRHVCPNHRTTPIYLPEQVAIDFRSHLGIWQQLSLLQEQGMVKLVIIKDGDSINVSGVKITPFQLAEKGIHGFLFTEGSYRVLVVMDDMFQWKPSRELMGVDLAILPMGVAEFNPLTDERRMGKKHPVLIDEATFDDTLSVVRRLKAKQVILSHIEEHDGLSYNDLEVLSERLRNKRLNVKFAFDSMQIRVGHA